MNFLLVLLVAFSVAQAVDRSDRSIDLTQDAEVAYARGDFLGAVKLYRQLIDEGVQSSAIYFNLGNAYYQLHDLGRALVNYRRAEQFMPRDEDLRLNLARVRAQRADAIDVYVGIGDQVAQWVSGWITNSEMKLFILIIWWICCGWSCAYMLLPTWRKRIRWGVIISYFILAFVGMAGGVRIAVETTHQSAVVISGTTSVMTGPDTKYMEIFELHAAGEVYIIERRNEWVRVQLPDLREGWIEAQAIEII